MPHRVEVIVQTIATELAAALPGVIVTRGFPDPLQKGETQRVCVGLGPDEAADSGGLHFSDYRLQVPLALQVRGATPAAAQQAAIELRLQTHQAMRGGVRTALRALGWVHDVEPGGAEGAEAGDSDGSTATVELAALWAVLYRSPHDDPEA